MNDPRPIHIATYGTAKHFHTSSSPPPPLAFTSHSPPLSYSYLSAVSYCLPPTHPIYFPLSFSQSFPSYFPYFSIPLHLLLLVPELPPAALRLSFFRPTPPTSRLPSCLSYLVLRPFLPLFLLLLSFFLPFLLLLLLSPHLHSPPHFSAPYSLSPSHFSGPSNPQLPGGLRYVRDTTT